MAHAIHKPGQGYWTRTMSAIGFGLIAVMGGMWVADLFSAVSIGGLEPIYLRALAFIVVAAISGLLIYYFIYRKPKSVDFLIATEGEMKKVNWSTRREVLGMTWVVIGLTIFIAIFVGFFDFFIYGPFFRLIRVIDTAG